MPLTTPLLGREGGKRFGGTIKISACERHCAENRQRILRDMPARSTDRYLDRPSADDRPDIRTVA